MFLSLSALKIVQPNEKMIDRQQKRMKEITMPETVYRRAVWAIKDLPRMEMKIRELESGYMRSIEFDRPIVKNSAVSDVTANTAILISNLRQSKKDIEEGLSFVPEKYREGIRKKLVQDVPYSDDFHINTWKKWQHVAIFFVAKKLGYI